MDVATMTSSVFGIPHVETSVLAFFFVGLALEVVVLSKPTHALVSYFALLVGFLVAPNISILEHCVLKFYYFCVLIKDSFNFPNYFHRTSAVNSFSGSRNCSLIVVFPHPCGRINISSAASPPDPQSNTQTLCDSSQVTCSCHPVSDLSDILGLVILLQWVIYRHVLRWAVLHDVQLNWQLHKPTPGLCVCALIWYWTCITTVNND